MKKHSQKTDIRRYLESGGKLTQMAALNFWGCSRLASRIFDINEDLYNEWLAKEPSFMKYSNDKSELRQVKSEKVKTLTGKFVSEYSLKKLD